MPPDHGAAVVRLILESPELSRLWREDLEAMRLRVLILRNALAAAHPKLATLADQTGSFSMLPISHDAVMMLRARDGIYITDVGRANLAGLQPNTIPPLVAALFPYLGGAL